MVNLEKYKNLKVMDIENPILRKLIENECRGNTEEFLFNIFLAGYSEGYYTEYKDKGKKKMKHTDYTETYRDSYTDYPEGGNPNHHLAGSNVPGKGERP